MNRKFAVVALIASLFAVAQAQAAVTMPTVDVATDIGTIVVWAIALIGSAFGAYLALPIAAKGFKAVQSYIGR